VLLTPLGQICGCLLDGEEARVLAELGVDDALFHHGFGVLETLVHGFVNLDEATLKEFLLIRELLLYGGLLEGNFLDLLEEQLGIWIHGGWLRLAAGVVVADRRLGWKWRWGWGLLGGIQIGSSSIARGPRNYGS